MPAPLALTLDPTDPGAQRFVSGVRHAVQVRRRVWTPLLTYMEGYNLTNAYNLGLLSQFAYLGGTSGDDITLMRGALDQIQNAGTREAAVSGVVGDFVLHRTDAADAPLPGDLRFLHGTTTETQGYIVSAGSSYTLIGFRGTEPSVLADWLRDGTASARRYAWGPGEMHTGFLEGFLSVRDALDAYLDDNWDPDSPLILCGHSLGGALATIAATYVRATRTDRVMLYTYGSPRAGDRTVADEFTSRRPIVAHRHVMHADIVPRLPPPGLEAPSAGQLITSPLPVPFRGVLFVDVDLKPFWHIGELRYLTHTSSGEVASQTLTRAAGPLGWEMDGWGALATYGEVMEASIRQLGDRIRGSIRDSVEPASHLVDDHSMEDSYVPAVARLLHGAIEDFLSRRPPDAEQAATHTRLRADEARLSAQIAEIEGRRRQALAEAFVLRQEVRMRESMVMPVDNTRVVPRPPVLLRPPGPLRPPVLLRPAPAVPELIRAEALEHAAAQWAETVQTLEGLRAVLHAQADGVYRVQGSLAGYDPVEGLREELARHIGETVAN